MTTADLITSLASPDRIKTYMAEESIPVQATPEDNLRIVVREFRNMKQGQAAAALINLTQGTISAETLTSSLKTLFPDDRVGERHGPHYLSHARTGKLKDCRFTPGTKRGSASPTPAATGPSQADLDTALKMAEDLSASLKAAEARIATLEAGIREAKALKDCKALLVEQA